MSLLCTRLTPHSLYVSLSVSLCALSTCTSCPGHASIVFSALSNALSSCGRRRGAEQAEGEERAARALGSFSRSRCEYFNVLLLTIYACDVASFVLMSLGKLGKVLVPLPPLSLSLSLPLAFTWQSPCCCPAPRYLLPANDRRQH